MTFKAPLTHKSLVTLCAHVALIRVAGILVLGEFLARGKPLLTLVTFHTLDLTVSNSVVLRSLEPTSESLTTNTAHVGPLV